MIPATPAKTLCYPFSTQTCNDPRCSCRDDKRDADSSHLADEWRRLREAKRQAESDCRTTALTHDGPIAVHFRVWNVWVTACDRLEEFEKQLGIGGGA